LHSSIVLSFSVTQLLLRLRNEGKRLFDFVHMRFGTVGRAPSDVSGISAPVRELRIKAGGTVEFRMKDLMPLTRFRDPRQLKACRWYLGIGNWGHGLPQQEKPCGDTTLVVDPSLRKLIRECEVVNPVQ
jgi:hypothetical protein